jgi:hypothetical protein
MQLIDMKNLVVPFLLAFLVLSAVSFAQDFTVSVNTNDYYVAAQQDYVTMAIHNNLSEDWFSVAMIGPEDWVKIDMSSSLIKVPSSGDSVIKILVFPPKDVVPLIYPYKYLYKVTRAGTNSSIEDSFQIKIKQITNAIIKNFKLSCTECTDSVDVSGTVYNVGSNPIELSLVFNIGGRQKTVNLGYVNIYGKQDFSTSFSLEGMQPGEYGVDTELMDVSGNRMYSESGSFSIPSIENVIYDKNVSSTIFGSFVTVSAVNMGNTNSDVDLTSINPSSWYSMYSGPTPTGMSITDNYFWRFTLSPNQAKSISYSEIYWPTYAIILLFVLAIVLVYLQSSAFSLSKNIMGDRTFRPGKEISVSLNLKNKKGDIDKAIVKDVVPNGYSIVSKFETVKPTIRKVPEGVELNWKVSKLKPDEERVFHYTIKPSEDKRETLPAAKVKAIQNNRLFQKDSNRVSLDQEKKKSDVLSVKVSK